MTILKKTCLVLGILGFVCTIGCSATPPTSGAGGAGGAAACFLPCGPAFSLGTFLSVPIESMRTLHAKVCRNESCVEGSLATIGGPLSSTSFPQVSPGTESARVSVTVTFDPLAVLGGGGLLNPYRLSIQYWPEQSADLQDGDEYSVMFLDSSGHAVFSETRTVVRYSEYPLNGPNCPVCRQSASVTGS